MDLNNI